MSMSASSRPDPRTIDPAVVALLDQALERHGLGEGEAAARLYAEVLEFEPDSPLALHNLGILRAGEGRMDEALDLIGRAVGADPASADARCNLGSLLAGAGRVGAGQEGPQIAPGVR